jgi:murein tripeptide amidase MpaA
MAYLNVDEIEFGINSLANEYQDTCQAITLPNQTTERRTCKALNVGRGLVDVNKPAILFTGAVHAREWGGSEICLYLAADLLEAYKLGKGVRYEGANGGKYFTAENIRSIMENLNVLFFPCVNPDGRNYSQTVESLWRRNRNPAQSGGDADCIGVDLNRNYDFLWDFRKFYHPNAPVMTSAEACNESQTYRGPAAFSEAETKNVKWLIDNNPTIKYHIDIHSFSQLILHCWGDDQFQSVDPEMNLANPIYDKKRGLGGNDYKEYVSPEDFSVIISLANRIHDGIFAVNQNSYKVQSGFDLYPTSGTGQDFSHSRHYSTNKKIIGYTIEFGKEFHPAWSEMVRIIREIDAGLLEFCLAVSSL